MFKFCILEHGELLTQGVVGCHNQGSQKPSRAQAMWPHCTCALPGTVLRAPRCCVGHLFLASEAFPLWQFVDLSSGSPARLPPMGALLALQSGHLLHGRPCLLA